MTRPRQSDCGCSRGFLSCIEDPRIDAVADELLAARLLPERARSDAMHVAIATVHTVEYLLTWNCKHIANANILPKAYRLLTDMGYFAP